MMYGYKLEYLMSLTYTQIRLLFEYGYKFDLYRRGWQIKDDDGKSWDEIRKDLWTEEELKAQEEFKKGKA